MTVEFIDVVCDIYFRSIILEKKGDKVDQHVHDHDHATYIGSGSARAWKNSILMGDYKAGSALPVMAGCYHEFEALEDNTRLTCVHDVKSAKSIKDNGL